MTARKIHVRENSPVIHVRAVAVAIAAFASLSAATAQQPLQQSPITPGFWSWPRQPAIGPEAVAAACRNKLAIQFADGRYFGVRLQDANKKPYRPAIIDEVGACRFDRQTQVERCELRAFDADGTVTNGVLESRFTLTADSVIRMTVTPKSQDRMDPSQLVPFDVYPVRCPDDIAWSALNGAEPPR
jgi:hypothetical protein